jgi:hypothetical protein
MAVKTNPSNDNSVDGGAPAMIDSTFRNGSLTAIGVVLGFSLGFFANWAALPGELRAGDFIAVATITLGVALQIKALANLLAVGSLIRERYERAVRYFLSGLSLVGIGVAIAILLDVVGLRQNVLGR